MTPIVLAVGALDASGADGLAADLRTCAALGVHGAAVATRGGDATPPLDPDAVAGQIGVALGGGRVTVVKLGTLGSAAMVRAVMGALEGLTVPIVADPSLAGEGGAADPGLVEAWRDDVLPRATVATPNLIEAALLTGTARAVTRGDMAAQAEALTARGCAIAVVSGGRGRGETSTDILAARGGASAEMRAERLERGAMRGLSATFAAAIAAHLAQGYGLAEAVQVSKLFVTNAILEAERDGDGEGRPLFPNQMARMWRRASNERPSAAAANGT